MDERMFMPEDADYSSRMGEARLRASIEQAIVDRKKEFTLVVPALMGGHRLKSVVSEYKKRGWSIVQKVNSGYTYLYFTKRT